MGIDHQFYHHIDDVEVTESGTTVRGTSVDLPGGGLLDPETGAWRNRRLSMYIDHLTGINLDRDYGTTNDAGDVKRIAAALREALERLAGEHADDEIIWRYDRARFGDYYSLHFRQLVAAAALFAGAAEHGLSIANY